MRTLITLLVITPLLLPGSPSYAARGYIEFVRIPSGSFVMGTQDLEDALIEIPPDAPNQIQDEQPAHKVFISAFEIGKYEITQKQWLDVMGTKPGPDENWKHSQWQGLPVVSVSWNMAQKFIDEINKRSSKFLHRLPTEAEFEYVMRDGSEDLRPFPPENMDDYAWTITNSGDKQQPVGQLKPNKFGVYDTFGNAWEWVSDSYHPKGYASHSKKNPEYTSKQSGKKVRRGGSYHCPPHLIRSAYRAANKPTQKYSVLGFRLVRINQYK